MILIRLKKIAINNNLSYAVIVTSQTASPNSSKFLEKIGFYRPIPDKWSNKYFYIDTDRLAFWLSRGAKLNSSVFLLIKPLVLNTTKVQEKYIEPKKN